MLKRTIAFRKGYLSFSFGGEPNQLENEIKKTCELLNKGSYLVEIFVYSDLVNSVFKEMTIIGKWKNFIYYLFDNVDFLSSINVADLRYLSIYAFDSNEIKNRDIPMLIKNAAFAVSIENHLDTCEIILRKSEYTKDQINKLKA